MSFEKFRGKIRPLGVRFWEKVKKVNDSDSCWDWIGSKLTSKLPYGQIQINRRPHLAHRISWELNYGEIPEHYCVLHKCDNPCCVRPTHLFLGSHADNNGDRHRKGRDARGMKNGNSSLDEDKIRMIKKLKLQGLGCRKISRITGINHSTICGITSGRSWKWLH